MNVATPRWDWPAIRAGAGVALVFAVPLAIGARIAADRDDDALAVGLSIGATIGFLVGAGCAAWIQRVGFPLSHALVTAGGTYVAAQTVFIAVRLVRGEDVRWFGALFTLTFVHLRRAARRAARAASALGRCAAVPLRRSKGAVMTCRPRARRRDDDDARRPRRRPSCSVVDIESRSMPPSTPFPGLVEFDAAAMAAAAAEAAATVVGRGPAPVAVGITNQRASTIVWDRATGEPIGPGIGWQDLRTVFDCITAKAEHGVSLTPNQSITKLAWLLANVPGATGRDLCFGTVDSWLAWTLTGGAVHATDHTNAAVTGLCGGDPAGWNDELAAAFGIPTSVLPRIVDSSRRRRRGERPARCAADRRPRR